MNDFTKEELIEIRDIMKPPLWFYEKKNCELINKIQSMIDNYCEHEWDNRCCGCEIYNIRCNKCDKSLEDYNENQ